MTSPEALREKAETFLAADPRIQTFEAVQTNDGLKVTATAAEDWFADRRIKACEALSTRILRQWRFVYERSYGGAREGRAPNFDVWISGFTNEAIPVDAMRRWLDGVLDQLRGVPHGRVLDVGCGSGLVLAKLAPGGAAYDGLDLSEEAISTLSAWAATQDTLRHVRLVQGAAHELSDRGGNPVDLVVLNSVAQYFPDAAYFLGVLETAAAQVRPNGSIFLGDLRATALLPMHAMNVAAARAGPHTTTGEVRAKARRMLETTGELSIDPGFFQAARDRLPRLGHVQFRLKPMDTDRELAGYRYDALLRLDVPEIPAAPVIAPASIGSILRHLREERPQAVAVLGLANARLVRDAALARALEAASADTLVETIKQGVGVPDIVAIEPEDLSKAAELEGYEAEMRFMPGAADGRFDALIIRRGEAARWPASRLPGSLSNDPLAAELVASLRRELQADLESALEDQGVVSFHLSIARSATGVSFSPAEGVGV